MFKIWHNKYKSEEQNLLFVICTKLYRKLGIIIKKRDRNSFYEYFLIAKHLKKNRNPIV